jgi:hypothetical protein
MKWILVNEQVSFINDQKLVTHGNEIQICVNLNSVLSPSKDPEVLKQFLITFFQQVIRN